MTDDADTAAARATGDTVIRAPAPAARFVRRVWIASAAAVILAVVLVFLRFYQEPYGFTYLLDYGATLGLPRLPEVSANPVFIHAGVPGYDAQSYSQLALRPTLRDPALKSTIDNVPYRSRRVFMGWVAWCLGFGQPWFVLNAYAVINLLAWLVLAWLLLRWFPPRGVDEFVRWTGVMLSVGMISSLRHALTDGPALVLLAGSVALFERGRTWPAAALGAAAGLTRETSVLTAVITVPARWCDWRGWGRCVAASALFAGPLALWMIYALHITDSRPADAAGIGAFGPPMRGYLDRWTELWALHREIGWHTVTWTNVLAHVGVTIQAASIVCWRRWSDPWWRIGAAHVAFMTVFGVAVWQGVPGAAVRALLPLTLAFNVLVPRTRLGLVVLIAGNLGIFAGFLEMRSPPRPTWSVDGPASLRNHGSRQPAVALTYGKQFYGPEGNGRVSWRWSTEDADLHIANAHDFPLRARVRAGLRAATPRKVSIEAAGRTIWSGPVTTTLAYIELADLEIPPGGLDLRIVNESTGTSPDDDRHLAVAVFDFHITLLGRGAAAAP